MTAACVLCSCSDLMTYDRILTFTVNDGISRRCTSIEKKQEILTKRNHVENISSMHLNKYRKKQIQTGFFFLQRQTVVQAAKRPKPF